MCSVPHNVNAAAVLTSHLVVCNDLVVLSTPVVILENGQTALMCTHTHGEHLGRVWSGF